MREGWSREWPDIVRNCGKKLRYKFLQRNVFLASYLQSVQREGTELYPRVFDVLESICCLLWREICQLMRYESEVLVRIAELLRLTLQKSRYAARFTSDFKHLLLRRHLLYSWQSLWRRIFPFERWVLIATRSDLQISVFLHVCHKF